MATTPTPTARLDSEKVRRRRERLGLTQSQAAALAFGGKAGKQNWSNIENGDRANPTLEVMGRMAAVLGLRVRDLIADDPKPPAAKTPAAKK